MRPCTICGERVTAGQGYHEDRRGVVEHARCRMRRETERATVASIVAWLRSGVDIMPEWATVADAIERGEWRQ